jgi:hypothetical protein
MLTVCLLVLAVTLLVSWDVLVDDGAA